MSDSCPVAHEGNTQSTSESENPAIPSPTPTAHRPRTNRDWWPNQPELSVLHAHSSKSNPMGENFDYAAEFAKLDVEALKIDSAGTNKPKDPPPAQDAAKAPSAPQ